MSPETLKSIIMISNLILATILAIALQKQYPCLLAIGLSGILGYILLNYIDNTESRYKLLGMGLCIFAAMQVVKKYNDKKPIFARIQDSLWEFVYFTIVLYYTLKLE